MMRPSRQVSLSDPVNLPTFGSDRSKLVKELPNASKFLGSDKLTPAEDASWG